MHSVTLSAFDFHFVKLLVVPRSSDVAPVDRATLHNLMQQAALEAFGTVGASLGDAMTIADVANESPAHATDKSTREVILRLANS